MNLSEISRWLARLLGETQGRTVTEILAEGMGVSNGVVHLLMIIEGLLIIGAIAGLVYCITKKIKKVRKKK